MTRSPLTWSPLTWSITRLGAAGVIAAGMGVGGCADHPDKYAQIGAIGGVLLGTYLGSRVGEGVGRDIAMAGGAALGGMLGYYLGHKLDAADRERIEEASQQALRGEIGEEVEWSNPDSGNRGSITPIREQVSSSGHTCREFTQKIRVGKELESRRSLACRADNGHWYVVEDQHIDTTTSLPS